MKRLKTLSLYRYLLVYIALFITNVYLINISYFYILFFIPFLLFLFYKHKTILFTSIILSVIFILLSFYQLSLHIEQSETYVVKVIGDIQIDDNTSFIGTINHQKVMVYDKEIIDIKPGDILGITGELQTPLNSTIPTTFDYAEYLKSQNIKYILYSDTIDIQSHHFHYGIFAYHIEHYIDLHMPYSGTYVKTFILANKEGFDYDFKAQLSNLGISHLFAVSGLHVGLLVMVLDKLFKFLFKREHSYIMIIPILLIYTIITSFSPSISRAALMYILFVINKKFVFKLSSLDILSITYLILLFIRPFYYYNMGFSLSFLVTFFILLGSTLLQHKPTIVQLFLITLLAMVATLPLITSLNQEINLMTLLVNVIFIYYMTYLILPFGYFTFFLFFLDGLYGKIIVPFEYLIAIFSQSKSFTFQLVFISPLQVVIYYVILLYILANLHNKKKRRIFISVMIIFIILSMNIVLFNPVKSVNMIDVYGDSILIVDSFDSCNILVDTGYRDSSDKVLHYIRGKGIKRLDYLIITHEHDDHFGERDDIVDGLEVVTIIDRYNESEFDEIQCGSLELEFFHMSEYPSENNKSIVFGLLIEEVYYLFTGDMESNKESEFVTLFNVDIDYLKSGHHGSITSSSELFLDSIHAENVLVSCYRNNFHGHPSEVVIKRYEERGIKIYRTDYLGTIEIKYFLGREYKKYHQP